MTGIQTTLSDAMVEQKQQFNTVVIGLGKTGLSCVRFLARQGVALAVADSRNNPPELYKLREEYPDVPFYPGPFDKSLFSAATVLVISPGISQDEPAIKQAVMNGAELVGDVELFARHAKAPVVAITGSNGKSTVASLVSYMIQVSGLEVALGGNIGTPALSLLESNQPDYYVLELSSFQLETVYSLDAVAAVVLNISMDHMDRYDGIEDYANAKEKIYAGTGTMVINDDDARVVEMSLPDRKLIRYSLGEPQSGGFGLTVSDNIEWLSAGENLLLPVSEVRLKGRHNLSNVLAALALGNSISLPMESMLSAVKEFSGLPHRCEWVANINGVDWINDSKGTNPGASSAAIEGLSDNADIVLIAGGDGKGADFSLFAQSARGKVHTAVLIGRDANRLAASLDGIVRVCYATSMEAAVSTAARLALPGNKVLLSPACASLDMFRDYQHRGESFRQSVLSLARRGVADA